MAATTSLWLDRPSARGDRHAALTADIDVDVAIVGGGIVGSAAAALLAESDLSTVLLEARTIGSGTTGNSTAKATVFQGTNFTTLIDELGQAEARLVVDADRAALDVLRHRVPDLPDAGGIIPVTHWAWARTEAGRTTLEEEAAAAARLGVRTRWATDDELALGTSALGVDDQLLIEPALLARAMSHDAADRGVAVHEHTRVVDVDRGDIVSLTTSTGARVRARHVVLATQVPILDRTLVFSACDYRRSHVLAFDAPNAATRFPGMYTGVESGTLSLRPATTRDGKQVVVVAGHGHGLDDDESGTHLEQLEASARGVLGDAVGDLTHAWLAHDAFPSDHRPFVGPALGMDNVHVATGFGGWGLARGVAASMAIVAHIRRGHARWEHPFDATRLSVYASRTSVANIVKSSRSIILDRITADDCDAVRALAPGEGTVVRHGLNSVAVARDRSGTLHSVDAACTHLGCIVRHDAERGEWQCPCHGSRFSIEGAVLAGPAMHPLEPVDLPDAD